MDRAETQLRAMMRPYQSPQHTVVGCHLRGDAVRVLSSGPQVSEAPCDNWMFEIASITKVFTAILLCVLVEEGKIDPKAPLHEMSDVLADVPEWITPERLATHTSGLPNYVTSMWRAVLRPHPDGPYAAFSRADLLTWFRHRRGRLGPKGYRNAYSNLGMGLLGEAMAILEGKPFAELLAEKVTGPMGLRDTTGCLTPDQQRRFAQPRRPNGKPTAPWVFQSLAGAGALRTSARDLARFAGAVIDALNGPETVLDHAICRSVTPILGLGPKGRMTPMAQCSGWLHVRLDPKALGFVFHNGGTAGSSCALYISPTHNAAVGILSNNGIAGHLWGSLRLDWSNPMQRAHDLLALRRAGARQDVS